MKSEQEIKEMFKEGDAFLKDLNKLLIKSTDRAEAQTLQLASSTMFARLQVLAWVLDKKDLELTDYISTRK